MQPANSSTLIAPLNSLRFLAAMHLFLFHLNASRMFAAEQSGPSPFRAFEELPVWFVTWVERGYCSTSLFFLLSGFVLGYLYLDADGRNTVPARQFWWARFTRIYPLHIGLLLLIAPIAVCIAGTGCRSAESQSSTVTRFTRSTS
jgi:peptidoglycan/LPS O-acetylase OafA/YrhL